MVKKHQFLALLDKYLSGNCTPEEEQWLLRYYDRFQHSKEWDREILGDEQEQEDRMLEAIRHFADHSSAPAAPRPFYRRRWMAVSSAAAILLLAGFAVWHFWENRGSGPEKVVAGQSATPLSGDRLPGGNKAILTLADGSVIELDDAQTGTLAYQGSTEVRKLSGDELSYYTNGKTMSTQEENKVQYNILTTPRGGQYQLRLQDGTKVWLNASSSIKYPSVFTGNERRIEISGEAYFEVAPAYAGSAVETGKNKSATGGLTAEAAGAAKNKAERLPFIVAIISSSGKEHARVEVLGTHFNIMAYEDEAEVKTTLLEGSVKFSSGKEACLLASGQQSRLKRSGGLNVVSNYDVEEAVAWKNGFFQFDEADLQTIMRQLARWYDVEVVYHPGVPERQFAGQMSMAANLSETLRILDASNVHFRIEGKQLIVMP